MKKPAQPNWKGAPRAMMEKVAVFHAVQSLPTKKRRFAYRVEFTATLEKVTTRVVRFTKTCKHIGEAIEKGRDEAYSRSGPFDRLTDFQVSAL